MIHQSATEIATEIRLTRSQHSGSFLVVEGRDDRLFMEGFTCRVTCNIMVAQGKQNVCEVIRILDESNFAGVLGLVDADFDRVESIPSRGPNILMPEYHDLETMLLCSPALDRILIEFGSQDKIDDFGENVGCVFLIPNQGDFGDEKFAGADFCNKIATPPDFCNDTPPDLLFLQRQ